MSQFSVGAVWLIKYATGVELWQHSEDTHIKIDSLSCRIKIPCLYNNTLLGKNTMSQSKLSFSNILYKKQREQGVSWCLLHTETELAHPESIGGAVNGD